MRIFSSLIAAPGPSAVGATALGRFAPAGEIARQHVDLEVHARTWLQLGERGYVPGVRDDVHAEDVVLHLVDGERHALDGDRALRRDETVERLGGADPDAVRAAFHLDRNHFAHAVDVTGDDVPAELVADLGRALQIDPAADRP